ncbi:MAG: hypothetical protein HUJ95_05035 [Bacteroidales bacterium]|nr:hypothetical protein [Bacteroidales bacterium]
MTAFSKNLIAMTFLIAAVSQGANAQIVIEDGGSGPYKAVLEVSAEAPDYTLYHPADMDYAVKKEGALPLILWANGGCAWTSKGAENYLSEVASHGYMVVAVGVYDEKAQPQQGMTDTEYQIHAIDVMQALNDNPESVFYKKIDMKHICAIGHSCGGGQALTTAIADSRVTSCIALNSGFSRVRPPFPVEEPGSRRPAEGPKDGFAKSVAEGGLYGKEFGGTMTQDDLANLHCPVAYLIGGPTDIAYNNANENFELINQVPVVLCNLPVGHGATYTQHHGGAFAEISIKWFDFLLKGNKKQGRFFLNANYQKKNYPDWDVRKKNW